MRRFKITKNWPGSPAIGTVLEERFYMDECGIEESEIGVMIPTLGGTGPVDIYYYTEDQLEGFVEEIPCQ